MRYRYRNCSRQAVHGGSAIFTPTGKREFISNLADSWPTLADELEIPRHERARFERGEEARGIWDLLEARGKLPTLLAALESANRADLALKLRCNAKDTAKPAPALERDENTPPADSRTRARRAWWGLPVLLGLAIVVATTVYVVNANSKSTPTGASESPSSPAGSAQTQSAPTSGTPTPATGANPGPAVVLTSTSEGARRVRVTVQISQPARDGHVYWFVLHVHNVSRDHSEYYPRQLLRASTTFPMSIPSEADISRPRSGAMFEVTDEISDRFESNRPDPADPSADFLLVPPCCAVSDEIPLEFRST